MTVRLSLRYVEDEDSVQDIINAIEEEFGVDVEFLDSSDD